MASETDRQPAEQPAKEPAQRLIAGRYRLVDLIGHGSMGTVWRAYDDFLHRPVAVKEVRLPVGIPDREADELRERTMREARAIGVLSHPNVVTLHDIAQEDGNPFVVMELVPGSSLAHLIRAHGPLDSRQAAAVADAVAAALQAAHQKGITHRDVKPANVLVAADGRIKLADFGIARNISEHTLTSTGITLGSPAYIAPEVASGGEVTNAADLWSLGATLFAAIEGHAPYDPEGDVIATLLEVVNGEVPEPKSTGPIAELVTELMVKDGTARITLADLRRRLYPLLPEPGTSPFTVEAIAEAESATYDLPVRETRPAEPEEETDEGQPSLAEDPGPLPFMPPPEPVVVKQRRGVPTVLIYAAAVLVFVAAAGGGFVLSRYAGGKPLLPAAPAPVEQPLVAPPPPTQESDYSERSGDNATLKGAKGGAFRIKVPTGWETYVEERRPKAGPESTHVHYVSQDGKYELTVERFLNYLPNRDLTDYQAGLQAIWPGKDAFVASDPKLIPGIPPDEGQQLKYNTVDSGSLRRTTYANVMTKANDLWVVSLTVPTLEEDTGRDIFDEIAPSFTLA
ncbi:tRNA A-37 threonylcarbamoyl transferase component Bud32 [Kibdelosporangium banguiense]|uniref:non-specific serine/threonine protein kinase n=1 Tax=Kibdelosporangium banguiense TaxID=1365924 RepID=A0ABS4TEA6_9PSEU|nr:serine/threonine-protein kinase [Kibdelosporangium banguiense]MBP2322758.1 tRNA A-37 threonylcarbamoyl transferase component Bud32 [Kibdelosporangium banguiense]